MSDERPPADPEKSQPADPTASETKPASTKPKGAEQAAAPAQKPSTPSASRDALMRALMQAQQTVARRSSPPPPFPVVRPASSPEFFKLEGLRAPSLGIAPGGVREAAPVRPAPPSPSSETSKPSAPRFPEHGAGADQEPEPITVRTEIGTASRPQPAEARAEIPVSVPLEDSTVSRAVGEDSVRAGDEEPAPDSDDLLDAPDDEPAPDSDDLLSAPDEEPAPDSDDLLSAPAHEPLLESDKETPDDSKVTPEHETPSALGIDPAPDSNDLSSTPVDAAPERDELGAPQSEPVPDSDVLSSPDNEPPADSDDLPSPPVHEPAPQSEPVPDSDVLSSPDNEPSSFSQDLPSATGHEPVPESEPMPDSDVLSAPDNEPPPNSDDLPSAPGHEPAPMREAARVAGRNPAVGALQRAADIQSTPRPEHENEWQGASAAGLFGPVDAGAPPLSSGLGLPESSTAIAQPERADAAGLLALAPELHEAPSLAAMDPAAGAATTSAAPAQMTDLLAPPRSSRAVRWVGIVVLVLCAAALLVAMAQSKPTPEPERAKASRVSAMHQPKPLPSPAKAATATARSPTPVAAAPTATAQLTGKALVQLNVRPVGALVYDSGQRIGEAPLTVEIEPGRKRTLELVARGYAVRRLTLDGSEKEVNVAMKPRKAKKKTP